MSDFIPLFLVRFPYRNRDENRCFRTFPKQKYRKDWFFANFDPYF